VSRLDGTNQDLVSPMRLPAGEWFHIAATYDGIVLRLYLNGRIIQEVQAQGRPGLAQHLWLSHPDETLRGSLDEVTLYGRALGPEEIQAIYAAGKYGKCK